MTMFAMKHHNCPTCRCTEPISQHQPKDFGRNDLMALAAVRYCLGRMTYIVSDCADWLIAQWENIEPTTQKLIVRDIKEALERDCAGMECDRRQWENVLKTVGGE